MADFVAKVRCVSALTMVIVMRSVMGASDDGAAQRRVSSFYTAPAEDALPTAVAIAQQARSFDLRAALSLAKLYHSTDRPANARAVLAFAPNGFSPTPKFPEIAEAQTLLTALAS